MMRPPAILLLLHFAVIPVLSSASGSDCRCGAKVNATTFTQILETDFLHVRDLSDISSDWTPQAYSVAPAASRGPEGKIAQVENVVTNSIASEWDWSAPPDDPGLQLWVKKERVGNMVPMSEIVSVRDDLLYGSFRIGMKGTRVNGTCAAFFFYFNDTEEIDMEFLSRKPGVVNLVIQSPESQAVGYVAPGSGDFNEQELDWDAPNGYHEYRFDWWPDRVEFYADSRLLGRIDENVPRAAGRLHISHWSNGNDGWSAGPPEEDAVLTTSYVKAYFNSSVATSNEVVEDCKPCEVPSLEIPPDPTGPNGNQTGDTFFLGDNPAGRNDPSRGNGDGRQKDAAASACVPASLLWASLLTVLVVMI